MIGHEMLSLKLSKDAIKRKKSKKQMHPGKEEQRPKDCAAK